MLTYSSFIRPNLTGIQHKEEVKLPWSTMGKQVMALSCTADRKGLSLDFKGLGSSVMILGSFLLCNHTSLSALLSTVTQTILYLAVCLISLGLSIANSGLHQSVVQSRASFPTWCSSINFSTLSIRPKNYQHMY